MATEPRTPRLAILIDGDNISPDIAARLFEEIAKIGDATVRRIYGDFSGTNLTGWVKILSTYAIMPQQNCAHPRGKNASDIALVIDAMDLLHSGHFDGFCLVSSDSDFTKLAFRIRDEGIDVYGFGEPKTPMSFVRTCRHFINTKNWLPILPSAGEPQQPAAPAKPDRKPPSAAIPLINKAIKHLNGKDGWVDLGSIGNRLTVIEPGFAAKNYGQTGLAELVKKTGAFEIRQKPGREIDIRVKSVPGKSGTAKPASAPKK